MSTPIAGSAGRGSRIAPVGQRERADRHGPLRRHPGEVGRATESQRVTITVSGARGGHGTSTIGAVIALLAAGHRQTTLVGADAFPILGLPDPADPATTVPVTPMLTIGPSAVADVVVVDAGTAALAPADDRTLELVVLRGPCYLGVRELVGRPAPRPSGIVLVVEKGRSLSKRDVEEVLGYPVVAQVEHSARVARTIDAGLLAGRLHALREFGDLRRWVRRVVGPDATGTA